MTDGKRETPCVPRACGTRNNSNYLSVIRHLKGKKVKSMIEERRYSKRELARLYWPKTQNIKSAMKNLRQDIKGCPELVEALSHTHWNINRHSYSAEQVRLIVKFLCEP
jgi:hypothetical protein